MTTINAAIQTQRTGRISDPPSLAELAAVNADRPRRSEIDDELDGIALAHWLHRSADRAPRRVSVNVHDLPRRVCDHTVAELRKLGWKYHSTSGNCAWLSRDDFQAWLFLAS